MPLQGHWRDGDGVIWTSRDKEMANWRQCCEVWGVVSIVRQLSRRINVSHAKEIGAAKVRKTE